MYAISQERRKIAWTRINPKLKSLATEEYEKRETNLFGPGFLEKASKRIEVDKTMEKVSTPSHKGGPPPPPPRRRQGMRTTNLISVVFYPRAPLQGTAAGNISASSRTTTKASFNPRSITRGQQELCQIRAKPRNPSNPNKPDGGPCCEECSPLHLSDYSNFTSTISRVSSSSGAPQPLLQQLETNYKRQLGATVSAGVSVGTHKTTNTEGTPTGAAPIRDCSTAHRGGGGKVDTERGSTGSECNAQPVYQQYICSPEEGWLTETSGESQAAQYLCEENPFQDGRSSHDQGVAEEGRLDGLHRPQRRLPISSSDTNSSQISAIQLERSDLQVSVPSLRPQQCPTYVYKGIETGHGDSEAERNAIDYFHRRHPLDSTISTGIAGSDPGSNPTPATSRIQDKLGKVSADSMSGDNLPRLPDKLRVDDDLPSQGETTGHHRGLQDGSIPRVSVCTYSGQNYRQDDSGSSGNCHSTIALQEVTVCKEQSIPVHSVIRVDHRAGYGSQSRVTMVDQRNRELEWKQYTTTDTGYGNRNRCFPAGLGSVDGQYNNRGAMVTGREIATHQCTLPLQ